MQMLRFTNAIILNVLRKILFVLNLHISPDCYASYSSDMEPHPKCKREGCGGTMTLLRHVSFVDCPGHDALHLVFTVIVPSPVRYVRRSVCRTDSIGIVLRPCMQGYDVDSASAYSHLMKSCSV